jgi:hypothetical protein
VGRAASSDTFLNLSEVGRYLNVSTERARQVAGSDPTFPRPVTEPPRRWKPRQGRAVGRAALVGHAAVEEAERTHRCLDAASAHSTEKEAWKQSRALAYCCC